MIVAIRRMCVCDARRDATGNGEFIYLPSRHAWTFTKAPRRSMSAKARYYAFAERREYPHKDYEGEPVLWETCFACGNDLPGTPTLSQADGYTDGEGAE